MTIPERGKIGRKYVRPMQHWEHYLSNWVSFVIVPIFAFFNAGVSLAGFGVADLTHPVVLGVALGLILGKQIGIFGAMFGMIKLGVVPMPAEANWKFIYGTSIVCGIGFTMILFVATLAFPPGVNQEMAKIGIFIGSIVAGLLGAVVLIFAYQIRKMRGKI